MRAEPLDDTQTPSQPQRGASRWPPFPWNPPDLDDPLIGRGAACEALERAIDDVVAHWSVRLQLLTSPYGLGKSRVMRSTLAAAAERHPGLKAVFVGGPALSGGGSFRMWDAVLRGLFDVPRDLAPDAASARLVAETARYLLPEDAEFLVRALTNGRGGASSDSADVARCSTLLGRLFEGAAFEQPLVIAIDDAHRGSPRDFALAASLPVTVKGRPLLLLLAGSLKLADAISGFEQLPTIRLDPLGAPDAERMLRLYLTGLGELPSRLLLDRLIAAGGGNAYAIKALVRWLHEARGIVEAPDEAGGHAMWHLDVTRVLRLQVPDNLDGLIHARLAAMPPEDRELLARAASVGREFWTGALLALARSLSAEDAAQEDDLAVPEGLPRLARFDLVADAEAAALRDRLGRLVEQRILEARPSRLRGEDCWGFRTSVMWQAAQEELPTTTREAWHAVILGWLESRTGAWRTAREADGRLQRELARHAELAGLPAVAATHHHRAAELALEEGHPRAALSAIEDALRVIGPEQRALRLELMRASVAVYEHLGMVGLAEEHAERALALAWRLADRHAAADVLTRLAGLEAARGAHELARSHLVQALRLHEVLQDARGIAAGSLQLGRWYWKLGDLDRALACYRKAETLYEQLGDLQGVAEVRHAFGTVHHDRGDVQEAQAAYEQALELRRQIDDRRGVVRTLNNLACVWMARRLERAVHIWEEAFELARQLGDLAMQASVANNLGEGLALLGRIVEARTMLQRAAELAELTGDRAVKLDALRNHATLLQREGDFGAARDILERAFEEARRLGFVRLEGLIVRSRGDLAAAEWRARGAAEGDPARAEAVARFQEATELFGGGGYDLEAADTWDRLAEVRRAAEGPEEARARAEALRAAHAGAPGTPPPLPASS
jgi:tetratricopeptide (TPR) repeat protein